MAKMRREGVRPPSRPNSRSGAERAQVDPPTGLAEEIAPEVRWTAELFDDHPIVQEPPLFLPDPPLGLGWIESRLPERAQLLCLFPLGEVTRIPSTWRPPLCRQRTGSRRRCGRSSRRAAGRYT